MAGTLAAVEVIGGRGAAYVADVRDGEAVEAAVEATESKLGPIYGLVTAAGNTRPSPASTMPAEDWHTVIDVHLTGTFLTVQSAGRRMLERGEGAVTMIGSVASFSGVQSRANYVTAKHGLVGLARTLAIEWGPAGVRVNIVCPGPVDTPLFRGEFSDEDAMARLFLPRLPLGRLSKPEDPARAAVLLLSDYASYITGVALPVDGGLSAGNVTDIAR